MQTGSDDVIRSNGMGHGAALMGGLTENASDARRTAGAILGAYRLLELLGEGGMGFVYLAEHLKLGRKVAIKTLRAGFARNPVVVQRFFGEARAVNQIRHDNIVQITDFVENSDGENYYVMEYLEGHSLSQLIHQIGPLPVARTLSVALQVADALAAVHAAGIIHRDLKSENIFLTKLGGQMDFVKLLDFGLAKLMEPTEDFRPSQTDEGIVLGTPEYMSPEQARGKAVDRRADIYSLGIILYEMLTAKKPFSGGSFSQIAMQHITQTPTQPSKVRQPSVRLPRRMENLIMDCLAKDPQARPQSMLEVQDRLLQVGRSESISTEAYIVSSIPRKRNTAWIVGLFSALAVAVFLGLGLGFGWFGRTERAIAGQMDAAASRARPNAARGEPQPLAPNRTIEIALDSLPPGADVLRGDERNLVGRTPLKLTLERSTRVERFEFRLVGHRPIEQKISRLEDARLFVSLLPDKRVGRQRSNTGASHPARRRVAVPKKRPAVNRDATVDPFQTR